MVPDQLPRIVFIRGDRLEGGKRFISSRTGSTIMRADTSGRHGRDHYGMHYKSAQEVTLGDGLLY